MYFTFIHHRCRCPTQCWPVHQCVLRTHSSRTRPSSIISDSWLQKRRYLTYTGTRWYRQGQSCFGSTYTILSRTADRDLQGYGESQRRVGVKWAIRTLGRRLWNMTQTMDQRSWWMTPCSIPRLLSLPIHPAPTSDKRHHQETHPNEDGRSVR